MPHPLLFYTFYWCLSHYLTFSGIVQDTYARFPSTAVRDIFVGNGKLIFLYIWPQKWCWSPILSLTSAHLNNSLCHGLVSNSIWQRNGLHCWAGAQLLAERSFLAQDLEKQFKRPESHHLFSMLLGFHITSSQPTYGNLF